ncbi:Trehalose synthase [uncultured archaeon]|nr:Trehalose synthase [uncultured archaeon]
MNIGIYQPWIYQRGGMEKDILCFAKNSKHKIIFYTNNYNPKNTFRDFKKFKVIQLNTTPVERDFISNIKTILTILNTKIPKEPKIDVLLVSTGGFGELISLNYNERQFLFCHTPIRAFHDEKFKKHGIQSSLFKIPYVMLEKKAFSKYSKIIVHSQNVKNRIVNDKLADSRKIKKVYGCTKIYKKSNVFKKYFFAPGRIHWTKGFEKIIEEFKEFEKKNKGFNLIIGGNYDQKNKKYYEKLKKLINPRIQILTNTTEKQFDKLYEECYCVIFNGLNEDWGLVNLEGFAHGKPVISINEGGPLEQVINGKNGFLCKENEFHEKMSYVASHPEKVKKMGEFAFSFVKKYSEKEFARQIDEILEKLD